MLDPPSESLITLAAIMHIVPSLNCPFEALSPHDGITLMWSPAKGDGPWTGEVVVDLQVKSRCEGLQWFVVYTVFRGRI